MAVVVAFREESYQLFSFGFQHKMEAARDMEREEINFSFPNAVCVKFSYWDILEVVPRV